MDHNQNSFANLSLSTLKTVILAVLVQLCLQNTIQGGRDIFGNVTDPYSNTGSVVPNPLFRISLGWLTMSFNSGSMEFAPTYYRRIEEAICRYFYTEVIDTCPPICGYKMAFKLGCGGILALSRNRPDFVFCLPQAAIDSIPLQYVLGFIREMTLVDAKVTRVDFTIDDFTRSLSIDHILRAAHSGNMVARTRVCIPVIDRDIKTGEYKQHEARIFKRSSNFFVRAYDKFLESKGKINSIRFEAEVKDKLARAAMKALCDFAINKDKSPDDPDFVNMDTFKTIILGTIANKIDFRDKNSKSRVNRRNRLDWWDEFLQKAQKLSLEITQQVKTIEKSIKWVKSQVAPTLAMLEEHFKGGFLGFLRDVVIVGGAHMKSKHLIMLMDAKKLNL